MRKLSLYQVCHEEQDGVLSYVYLLVTNMYKERRKGVQDQDEPSRRDHMLEACQSHGDHGYVKICPKERLSHSGVWGSNLQVFTKLAQSRKKFHLEVNKVVIINLKWNMLKEKVCS